MNLHHAPSAVLETELLVQYLHGALGAAEVAGISKHLASCEACRSTCAALETRMRRASDVLGLADHAAPDRQEWLTILDAVRERAARGRRKARLLMAAGFILTTVAAASLASAPVRAWITDHWARVSGGKVAEPAAPDARSLAGLQFTVRGPDLDITFGTAQSDGALHMRFTEEDQVDVAVSDGGSEQLTTGEITGIRVANQANATASWDVRAPAGIERVRIRIGRREPIELDRATYGRNVIEVSLVDGAVRNRGRRDEP